MQGKSKSKAQPYLFDTLLRIDCFDVTQGFAHAVCKVSQCMQSKLIWDDEAPELA
jgi:hypothetical protein